MLNKILICGRLTRSPEIKTLPSGSNVANFSVACDRDIKNKQTGEKETDFIECVAFGSTCSFIEKYVTKGRMVIAEGRLQIRTWKDKDGNNRKNAEVMVDNIYFADSKREAGEAPVGKQTNFTDITDDLADGELPF